MSDELMRVALDALRTCALGLDSPLTKVLVEFATSHSMFAQRDGPADDERWTLRVNHERMERWVQVRITQSDWSPNKQIEITSSALWHGAWLSQMELQVWSAPTVDRRWFGLTDVASPEQLLQTLELAYEDAITYAPSDLSPEPEGASRRSHRRPW
jgi:hypothetical protein